MGGYVDFYKITTSTLPHRLDEFYNAFKVAIRSRGYDVVYISIGHCAPLLCTILWVNASNWNNESQTRCCCTSPSVQDA